MLLLSYIISFCHYPATEKETGVKTSKCVLWWSSGASVAKLMEHKVETINLISQKDRSTEIWLYFLKFITGPVLNSLFQIQLTNRIDLALC